MGDTWHRTRVAVLMFMTCSPTITCINHALVLWNAQFLSVPIFPSQSFILSGNPPIEEKRGGFEQQLKVYCSWPKNTMAGLFARLPKAVSQHSVNLSCGLGLEVGSAQWQLVMWEHKKHSFSLLQREVQKILPLNLLGTGRSHPSQVSVRTREMAPVPPETKLLAAQERHSQ